MGRVMLGKWIRHALLAAMIAPLGACAIADIGSGPAPSLYTLKAPVVSAEAGPQAGAQLVVEEFSAPAAIDTTRIVFQPNDNEIAYLPRLIRRASYSSRTTTRLPTTPMRAGVIAARA